MSNHNTYIIIPFVDVTQAMIDACAQTSFATLRHSIGGEDRVILKWEGSTPDSLLGYTQYTHSEILAVMYTDEWDEYVDNSSSSSGA